MTKSDKQRPSTYTFQDLDQDLNNLYEILKQENYKNQEIQRLLDPITSKIPRDQYLTKTHKIINLAYKIFLIIFSLITIIYLLTYLDTFYWNLTALTRICMINILPYFDWRYLKNEVCLVPNFLDQKIVPQNQEIFNCDLCESFVNFDELTHDINQDTEDLIYKFIDIDRPIVVTGGIEHWIKESPTDFIDQLINEREFAGSIPCKLSTNVHNMKRDDIDVRTLIKKSRNFDRNFLHFQNCDMEAMRIFRQYTYRPKVLPAELSPVTFNWLLWNKNYNSTKFKKIDLVEKYTVVGQIFGTTNLNLIPRKNCATVCPVLQGILRNGHFLVLTSLWDIEYLPDGNGENIAAILEIKG